MGAAPFSCQRGEFGVALISALAPDMGVIFYQKARDFMRCSHRRWRGGGGGTGNPKEDEADNWWWE